MTDKFLYGTLAALSFAGVLVMGFALVESLITDDYPTAVYSVAAGFLSAFSARFAFSIYRRCS